MGKDRPDISRENSRTGIFGGTFDPLHNGHLAVIRHVRRSFSLETVHVVLSSVPPHKTGRPLAPAAVRMEMLRLSLEGMEGLRASDAELRRRGPSFTIDTIEHFLAVLGSGCDLFFILGSDAFLDMGTWRRTGDILRLASLIVMARPGSPVDEDSLARAIRTMLGETFRYHPEAGGLVHPEFKPVLLCRVPEIPVSSTEIRTIIRNKGSISALVPGPVDAIIREKGLYR
jgi:nicotinate-nucleotide adenylyltransferase